METKAEMELALLSASVLQATVDLLGLVVLGDPNKDPVF
jgi:hypothetical protein